MSAPTELLAAAHAWLAEDPDADTVAQLHRVIAAVTTGDADALADLADRFVGPLTFGTAGLRGEMGAGPNRMNHVVVQRAAAGLAAYLAAHEGTSCVIGYDARHKSGEFAVQTARIMAGAGITALLLPRALPTPIAAFALRKLVASAAVVVTASHNPPADNGYKVYLGDGSQIVPPVDAEIAAFIAAVGPLADIPRADSWTTLPESIVYDYLTRAAAVVDASHPRRLTIVSTPLHGVGGVVLAEALERGGFDSPIIVPQQAEPDPDFPTVAFPNPEEPGALDLALALAVAENADLVIANDPDADRCAVAVPLPFPVGVHPWRMLTGDEVGALLGLAAARRLSSASSGSANSGSDSSPERRTLACSLVSSTLLRRIAEHHGLPFAVTLTGFKWIGRVPGLAFGYEEALGYCTDPDAVADKDGITAALVVADLAARLKAKGLTLLDELDELAILHGVHGTAQRSFRVSDLSLIGEAMARLRQAPPSSLGGRAVVDVIDLSHGWNGLPPTDGITLSLGGDDRVIVRPSGTEPKLKCYLQIVVPVAPGQLAAAKSASAAALAAVAADLGPALGLG